MIHGYRWLCADVIRLYLCLRLVCVWQEGRGESEQWMKLNIDFCGHLKCLVYWKRPFGNHHVSVCHVCKRVAVDLISILWIFPLFPVHDSSMHWSAAKENPLLSTSVCWFIDSRLKFIDFNGSLCVNCIESGRNKKSWCNVNQFRAYYVATGYASTKYELNWKFLTYLKRFIKRIWNFWIMAVHGIVDICLDWFSSSPLFILFENVQSMQCIVDDFGNYLCS